jgi:hypothetical protein
VEQFPLSEERGQGKEHQGIARRNWPQKQEATERVILPGHTWWVDIPKEAVMVKAAGIIAPGHIRQVTQPTETPAFFSGCLGD